MDRAHIITDSGQEVDMLIREFTMSCGVCGETEARIEGTLTRRTERKPQAPELMVTDVIYNDPATVVYWSDNTRTVVKCQPDDTYDPKTGFLLALCKKVCGNTGKYNDLLRECIPEYGEKEAQTDPSIDQMRIRLSRFCRDRICYSCPLGKPGFQCGRGYYFDTPANDSGYMTDESIVKHYKAMKGEHNHGHE